ncbi:MAG: hypothetical protein ACREHC_00670 [Candidatus Levyibacteriota bacterium]
MKRAFYRSLLIFCVSLLVLMATLFFHFQLDDFAIWVLIATAFLSFISMIVTGLLWADQSGDLLSDLLVSDWRDGHRKEENC